MLQRLGGFLLEYPGGSTWNKTPTWLISRLRMQPTRTAPHRTALHLTAARPCQDQNQCQNHKPNQTKPNPPAHSHLTCLTRLYSPSLSPSPYYFAGPKDDQVTPLDVEDLPIPSPAASTLHHVASLSHGTAEQGRAGPEHSIASHSIWYIRARTYRAYSIVARSLHVQPAPTVHFRPATRVPYTFAPAPLPRPTCTSLPATAPAPHPRPRPALHRTALHCAALLPLDFPDAHIPPPPPLFRSQDCLNSRFLLPGLCSGNIQQEFIQQQRQQQSRKRVSLIANRFLQAFFTHRLVATVVCYFGSTHHNHVCTVQ